MLSLTITSHRCFLFLGGKEINGVDLSAKGSNASVSSSIQAGPLEKSVRLPCGPNMTLQGHRRPAALCVLMVVIRPCGARMLSAQKRKCPPSSFEQLIAVSIKENKLRDDSAAAAFAEALTTGTVVPPVRSRRGWPWAAILGAAAVVVVTVATDAVVGVVATKAFSSN